MRVYENGELKRIFATLKEEITARRRKLHIEEFCNVYWPTKVRKVIKSRNIRNIPCFAWKKLWKMLRKLPLLGYNVAY
jgi:hypothetical protein